MQDVASGGLKPRQLNGNPTLLLIQLLTGPWTDRQFIEYISTPRPQRGQFRYLEKCDRFHPRSEKIDIILSPQHISIYVSLLVHEHG